LSRKYGSSDIPPSPKVEGGIRVKVLFLPILALLSLPSLPKLSGKKKSRPLFRSLLCLCFSSSQTIAARSRKGKVGSSLHGKYGSNTITKVERTQEKVGNKIGAERWARTYGMNSWRRKNRSSLHIATANFNNRLFLIFLR